VQVATGEDGAGWLAFLRDLTARGLTGVKRVTSDAHRGLVDAIAGEISTMHRVGPPKQASDQGPRVGRRRGGPLYVILCMTCVSATGFDRCHATCQ
jgi:hypothetical protein